MPDRKHRQGLPSLNNFEQRYQFNGGLRLAGNRAVSSATPIRFAGIPKQLVLPLHQHIGEPANCHVSIGDRVLKGDMIAEPIGAVSAPVHAPTSGTVIAIEPRPVPHPSGRPADCIVVETDGVDATGDTMTPVDYHNTDPAVLCEQIRHAGIVGLGGAGFPTPVKLAGNRHIELLLINGAECEPYISCDNALLCERTMEVIEGIRILQHILQPDHCVIAIEDNMPEAGKALRAALDATSGHDIQLVEVAAVYPTGGERQLIKVLTNREVPSQGLPVDIGIICQNVGTAAAIYHAVHRGHPLLSRIVTVTGDGVQQPCNLEVLIGTPVRDLVATAGGYTDNIERLLIGGPMMGYAINTDAVPVVKTTNCILAVTADSMPAPPPAQPCIRCGKCTEVCPADLLPQQLYWYTRSGNHDTAQDYGLFDCIECGCCAYVCPSHIPLVQYYRHAKTAIWAQEKQTKASDFARQRHEARLARLERIKQERAARLAKKKQAVSGDSDKDNARKAAIQAALERVQRKKAQADYTPANTDNLNHEQQQLIEAADQRRKARRSQDEDAD